MLIKTLPRIAAKVLHNTHVGLKNMKEKFALIEMAYGRAAVEKDFEDWCNGLVLGGINPRYPLTDYIKVIDERLGKVFEEKKADLKDPRIAQISAASYEETGFLPSAQSVGNLLLSFSPEEIIAALREYAATLDDADRKFGMKMFFTEGGATAVIYARQKRQESKA